VGIKASELFPSVGVNANGLERISVTGSRLGFETGRGASGLCLSWSATVSLRDLGCFSDVEGESRSKHISLFLGLGAGNRGMSGKFCEGKTSIIDLCRLDDCVSFEPRRFAEDLVCLVIFTILAGLKSSPVAPPDSVSSTSRLMGVWRDPRAVPFVLAPPNGCRGGTGRFLEVPDERASCIELDFLLAGRREMSVMSLLS
jgi:hypothetical protein